MTVRAVTDTGFASDVAEVVNASGNGDFLVVCEHASRMIPAEYGNLGLDEAALKSHIAWDPGAVAVAKALASRLNAPLVAQRYSRLLYDCNRPPESASAVPEVSEIYQIPGNTGLTEAERSARAGRFYFPFIEVLSDVIDQRVSSGLDPVIVTVHSFTPVYKGARREVELGVLHEADTRLADALIHEMRDVRDLVIRRNEPYGPNDGVCHTLVRHGVSRGLLNVMLEIRNDLIADSASQDAMADRLARHLTDALTQMRDNSKGHEFA